MNNIYRSCGFCLIAFASLFLVACYDSNSEKPVPNIISKPGDTDDNGNNGGNGNPPDIAAGKSVYNAYCAACHAAGADDTTQAFNAKDLAVSTVVLQTDLSSFGGTYQMMGQFAHLPQQVVDDLTAYFKSLK